LATSWHGNKFLNPATAGAVLPMLQLNGYKIANPTVLARIPRDHLEKLCVGYGYKPHFVEGDDPMLMRQQMAATLDTVLSEIAGIQKGGAQRQSSRLPAMAHDHSAQPEGLDRAKNRRWSQGRGHLALTPGPIWRHGRAGAREAAR
jgi:phosphoketolase